MTKKTLFATLALLAPLVLAGCLGDTPAPSATTDTGGAPAVETGPRVVAHALGNLTLDAPAKRVVVLEWPYVEAVLAIGARPVGVADVAGYNKLVNSEPALTSEVKDVGTRHEPNLEAIAALEPDLIIGVKFRHEKIHDSLSAIAPTLIFDSFPADGAQLKGLQEATLSIANALGRTKAGVDALARLDTAAQEARARLTAAGLAGKPFVLAQILAGDKAQLRLYHDHQVAVSLLEQTGIENAWEDTFAANGFSTVGLEALSRVSDANFLYVLSDGASLDAYRANPAWQDLAFVQEGRLYDLSGAWLLAGPLSGEAFIDRVTDALAPEVTNTPRTISHALGATTLTGTPTRIVALEWTYAEDVLALGVQPVGVADVAGYRTWVNVPVALADSVTDVGTRHEPNLEAIAALEPDLIIGVKNRHEKIHDTLTAIAPTLIFDPYPGEGEMGQLGEMRQTFTAIARALNREQQGAAVLAGMDAAFERASERLAAANATTHEVVLCQAYTANGAPVLRLFTDNAMAVEVLAAIGLQNAWEGGFQQYGFSTTTIEALQPVEEASFLYVVQPTDDVFANDANGNPAWKELAFVQEGRAHALGGDTWLFGGPLSAEVFAERIVERLTGA